MKQYKVIYREKFNTKDSLCETMVSADNIKEAKNYARMDLEEKYTIISVSREWN